LWKQQNTKTHTNSEHKTTLMTCAVGLVAAIWQVLSCLQRDNRFSRHFRNFRKKLSSQVQTSSQNLLFIKSSFWSDSTFFSNSGYRWELLGRCRLMSITRSRILIHVTVPLSPGVLSYAYHWWVHSTSLMSNWQSCYTHKMWQDFCICLAPSIS
jgi:hypothetical protein